ncbi:hypothetical protein H0H93_001024 [Arthromyces matolae]|nr:hypothetical protein H0H93_001024 [Arthromyces matolae]
MGSTFKNPYVLLGLSPTANVNEIKQAYRQMALRWHPDRHPKEENKESARSMFNEPIHLNFYQITHAYQALLQDHEDVAVPKSKLQTRLPTPMPRYRSLSVDSSTDSPTSFVFSRADSATASQTTAPSSLVTSGSVHGNDNKQDPPSTIENEGDGVSCLLTRSHCSHDHRARQKRAARSGTYLPIPGSSLPPTAYVHEKPGPPLRPLGMGGSGEWAYSLPLTLEDLFGGKRCYFCIVRHFPSGAPRRMIVEVDVPPGCRFGTRLQCRDVGNEDHGASFQDIVFVIEEITHPRFCRLEDDLYVDVYLPWADALMKHPEQVVIKGIDGQNIIIYIDYMRHRMLKGELFVKGAGMPIQQNGKVIGRSDLIVEYRGPAEERQVFSLTPPTSEDKTSLRFAVALGGCL